MIFCQRCKKMNADGEQVCAACGSPLMLLAPSLETQMFIKEERPFEEFVIERFNLIEEALVRANDQYELLMLFAREQTNAETFDKAMFEALVDTLAERHGLSRREVNNRWKTKIAQQYQRTIENERLELCCAQILDAYRGPQHGVRERFNKLVDEGTWLISDRQVKRGLRMLEEALALDEHNAELCFAIGEADFYAGKVTEAEQYLRRTVARARKHFNAQLLVGLLDSDSGQAESAKQHLTQALALTPDSFAAHYGLGRLLLGESKCHEALLHLKRALALRPSPEMQYLVGRVLWECRRPAQALKHLQKAVRLDPAFDAALYSLGWMCWQTDRLPEAREHLRAAHEANPREAQYRAALKAQTRDELPAPPALGWTAVFAQPKPRRTARHSETRLAALLRDDLDEITLTIPSRKKISEDDALLLSVLKMRGKEPAEDMDKIR